MLILENYGGDPAVDATLQRLLASGLRYTLVLSRERAPNAQPSNPFESAVHYTLLPLELADQVVFIRQALNVRPDLANRIATMTRGIPQLAYQVLADG